MYYSDKITDEKLEKLEKRIANMYNRAYKEMRATAKEYFEKYEERYEKEYEAYQNGAYTDAEFKQWVQTQVARGKGYEKFRDELADKMTNANKIASAYINDATPSVYSLNRDYEAYRINEAFGDFHLTDEMTVRRLAGFDNHIEFKTTGINRRKDYEWNRKQIHSALTAGILQGKSIDKLADSYMVVMKRNRSSAIRNARTSFTSAQNAGRIETYYRATEMGISLTKEWMSAHDGRVRDSHAHLDGERVAYDKPFSNGLMYPADPEGAPAEVYNCRCTLRAILPNINDKRHTEEKFNNWLIVPRKTESIETNEDKLIEETSEVVEYRETVDHQYDNYEAMNEYEYYDKNREQDRFELIKKVAGYSDEEAQKALEAFCGTSEQYEKLANSGGTYSFGWFYGQDTDIRTEATQDAIEKGKIIDKYIKDTPDYEGKIYRGLTLDEETLSNIKEGGEWTETGTLSSWSSNKGVANLFAEGRSEEEGGKPVVIICENVKYSSPVSHLSIYGREEDEVIVSNTNREFFDIISKEEKNGIVYVTLGER